MCEIIILCGGIGSRLNAGLFPKPLLLVHGIPLIYRMLDSLLPNLPSSISSITFLLNKHLERFNFESLIRKHLNQKIDQSLLNFWTLPFETRGALETLYLYLRDQPQDRQVIVLDNDNLYQSPLKCHPQSDGIFWTETYNALQHFSFVGIENNIVSYIEEKRMINDSDKICVGYYLSNIPQHINEIKNILLNRTEALSEYYISILFKDLINRSNTVYGDYVQTTLLGTIEDINTVSNTLTPCNVVFDIDNTLITTSGEAIPHMCEFLKYLKKKKHYIILYTARGMKHTANTPVSVDVKDRVIRDLKKFQIEYDELHFNKPYGDLYIDDKGFNPYDPTLFKKLGFYDVSLEGYACTDLNVNTLIDKCGEVIIKHSSIDLEGEINYYNIILRSKFSKYFPVMKSYGNSNRLKHYIELEYIHGPTFSNLYLEDLLTSTLLHQLLDIMDDLHSSEALDNTTLTSDIFKEFYTGKLYERKDNIESLIDNEYLRTIHSEIFETIKTFIQNYNTASENIVNLIHGDLWFRNILIHSKKIYLIDMRGRVGSKITVRGDKLYDYAKVYQSLIGLDHILNSQPINHYLKDTFERRYHKFIESIKRLTQYTIYCSIPSWNKKYIEKIFLLIKTLNE